VLGVSKDLVFVAGNEVVRAYRLGGGKLIWETPVDVSFGRGLLTSESIFIPTEQSVLELAPDNGRIQGEYGVDTERDEPLGNLFTDGERLFAMGLRRIYALNPILQPKTSTQGVGTPP